MAFYLACGSNAAVITRSKRHAYELRNQYFKNASALEEYDNFADAEAAMIYHLGQILPLDVPVPDSVKVNDIVFAGQLTKKYRAGK
ncbi:MAG: hypothetical protein IJN18_02690 [Clostridia bacterium]|nr:hypothetical protein [Clostridia bacterium]